MGGEADVGACCIDEAGGGEVRGGDIRALKRGDSARRSAQFRGGSDASGGEDKLGC